MGGDGVRQTTPPGRLCRAPIYFVVVFAVLIGIGLRRRGCKGPMLPPHSGGHAHLALGSVNSLNADGARAWDDPTVEVSPACPSIWLSVNAFTAFCGRDTRVSFTGLLCKAFARAIINSPDCIERCVR